jgi:hypothetical protein
MSMDLPAEFGSARSAELLVLVADRHGAILSRSRDWPLDIDPSNWAVKSQPVVQVASASPSMQPTWAASQGLVCRCSLMTSNLEFKTTILADDPSSFSST